MDVTIKILEPTDGDLYNNSPNQLRRAIGRYTTIHPDFRGGTVRDASGKYWDWWETEERFPDGWRKIKIIPAE